MIKPESPIEGFRGAKFIMPDLEAEKAEIERVAVFVGSAPEDFAKKFISIAQKSTLVDLTPQMWSELKNTESFSIHFGDWEEVAKHSESQEIPRDWRDLRRKMEQKRPIYAPIIVKLPHELHLVSGNTRLMVAKALGKVPKVLLVDLSE